MGEPTRVTSHSCTLCQKLRQDSSASRWDIPGVPLTVWESPFARGWPGSLMVVYQKHLEEMSDIYPSESLDVGKALIHLEKSLRQNTPCTRINLVKFGNECPHLHWHLIPRHFSEPQSKRNSWEIWQADPTYAWQWSSPLSTSYFNDVQWAYQNFSQASSSGIFGTSLFLRHADPSKQQWFHALSLEMQWEYTQNHPSLVESLLMKQNYGARNWDTIGGNPEPGEYPSQTAQRELLEEMGWVALRLLEVGRQWNDHRIKGFVYLAQVKECAALATQPLWNDNPFRVPCDEVEEIRYFNLSFILGNTSGFFKPAVVARHLALVKNEVDFRSP